MQLTLTPDKILWPETHYVFVEKTGPFAATAAEAWRQLQERLPALVALNFPVNGSLSLYKVDQKLYRAGVSIPARPDDLPLGLHYQHFHGGPYLRFTLTGSYSQLGEASARVWHFATENNIPLRNDFAIENYVNDPRTTPEADLITEILLPTA
jgi:hypothetical protein